MKTLAIRNNEDLNTIKNIIDETFKDKTVLLDGS